MAMGYGQGVTELYRDRTISRHELHVAISFVRRTI